MQSLSLSVRAIVDFGPNVKSDSVAFCCVPQGSDLQEGVVGVCFQKESLVLEQYTCAALAVLTYKLSLCLFTLFFLGEEVRAEFFMEELNNGVKLCQLIGVLHTKIAQSCPSVLSKVSQAAAMKIAFKGQLSCSHMGELCRSQYGQLSEFVEYKIDFSHMFGI